jgi:hypothetical protein
MVYLLQYEQPKHTPLSAGSGAGHQESNSSVSSTHESVPSGYNNNSDIQCQSSALKEDVEHDGEISDKSYAHFAVAVRDQIGATDVMQNAKGNTLEGVLNLTFYCLI